MSRIDEALKRATAGELGGPREGGATLGAARAGAVTLEDYPGELGGSSGLAAEPPRRASAQETRTTDLRQRSVSTAFESKLVVGAGISPVAVEQYRRLAATMHDLQAEKGLKSVLVTSAVPREGKTLSVTNLALTLSEAYRRRVLLIDADVRRPGVHELLSIPNRVGLRDVLKGQSAALPLVQASPLLAVLPAGQPDPNPIAGLASERMRALLAECARSFDWVLLDAPPVMLLPDAGLLSKLIEGVVFVIGAGTTPYPMVERAIAELGQDCIIGTVLNRVEERTIPATGYYHQYYHPNSAAG